MDNLPGLVLRRKTCVGLASDAPDPRQAAAVHRSAAIEVIGSARRRRSGDHCFARNRHARARKAGLGGRDRGAWHAARSVDRLAAGHAQRLRALAGVRRRHRLCEDTQARARGLDQATMVRRGTSMPADRSGISSSRSPTLRSAARYCLLLTSPAAARLRFRPVDLPGGLQQLHPALLRSLPAEAACRLDRRLAIGAAGRRWARSGRIASDAPVRGLCLAAAAPQDGLGGPARSDRPRAGVPERHAPAALAIGLRVAASDRHSVLGRGDALRRDRVPARRSLHWPARCARARHPLAHDNQAVRTRCDQARADVGSPGTALAKGLLSTAAGAAAVTAAIGTAWSLICASQQLLPPTFLPTKCVALVLHRLTVQTLLRHWLLGRSRDPGPFDQSSGHVRLTCAVSRGPRQVAGPVYLTDGPNLGVEGCGYPRPRAQHSQRRRPGRQRLIRDPQLRLAARARRHRLGPRPAHAHAAFRGARAPRSVSWQVLGSSWR